MPTQDISKQLSPELIQRYLSRRLEDLQILNKASEEKNIQAFKDIAHKMKGHAGMFGYPELEAIALSIEDGVEAKSFEKLDEELSKFRQWVNTHC